MFSRPQLAMAIALGVAAPPTALSQEADTSQSIEDVGKWLTSRLPRIGGFSMNVTGDWASVGAFRPITGSNRSVEARHQIRDVALENCALRYRGELRVVGSSSMPLYVDAVVPLGRLDISLMRIQGYVLPLELRATTPRFEVYLRALAASEGITVTDQDRRTIAVWEHSIPVDRQENAEQLAATLRRGGRLCGAP